MRSHISALCLTLPLAACGSGEAPTQALAQRGYQADAHSTCKAAAKGDMDALKLLSQVGPAAQSLVLDGERFCLEAALTGRHPTKLDVAAVLGHVQPTKAEFNRVYASSVGMTARDVPQADVLARAAGQRATDLYADGAVVEATPLMWAVWSGDLASVQVMLSQGADPNLAAIVPVRVAAGSAGLVRIRTTPLFEAHRLNQVQIAKLLTQHGAKPQVGTDKPKA
jgi:Ankyrin repeat